MWKITSWRNYLVKQIPKYPVDDLVKTQKKLQYLPPLVAVNKVDALKQQLATLQKNNGFIVQLGECAETFAQANYQDVAERINLITEFSKILSNKKNILPIGRIAGQYAKPRSSNFENTGLHIYKGDMVHDYNLRQLDADRFLVAYEKSAKTLKYMRYHEEIYTSHEALMLPYEECFTYKINNIYYNLTAHMLWLGDKTRFINSAHVEYLRGINNPIGIKVSHNASANELCQIIKILNPTNTNNKIILINRMGIKYIKEYLPNILASVQNNNLQVHWLCDPMHGNTFSTNNYKTRNMFDIIKEVEVFQEILNKYKVYFAGIHLEATYQNVTECLDSQISPQNLGNNYKTFCDPRLNKEQTIELAKIIKDLL
ncbi:Phospho-2-dehydro-3-deoxyheptonate aldolase AroG [Candidatus Hepatincola sp. Pdp]